MKNKICIVTGATSGIGKYTALGLAQMGASVVLVGRSQTKCEETAVWIMEETENPDIGYLVADLSSQIQIRRLVNEFKDHHQRLDVLVNNAGGVFLRRKVSVDGIEMTFALNHLSYFLITNLLLDLLLSSSPSRIVNVSSGSHYGRQIDFDNLELKRGYGVYEAYGRSKFANVLFSYELARRLEGTGVTAIAMSPSMVATNIWMNAGPIFGRLITWYMNRKAQSSEQGAQAVIHLASSPQVEGVSGKYFHKMRMRDSDPETYNSESAKRLWEISLTMTGLGK